MTSATSPARLLIVDDEPSVLETISAILEQEGYEVASAKSVDQALSHLRQNRFDLVLTDLRMEGESGLTLIGELRQKWPETTAVMLTGYASIESAINALREGAYDYLLKPCNVEELKATVARAVERGALGRALRERLDELNTANTKLLALSEQLQERVDQATAELSEKVRELAHAKERLEEANRTREEFIGMVAHDLGQPLTTIAGYAQILGRSNVPAEMQERARSSILSETRRLHRLVQDLADASHLSSGRFQVYPVECDLVQIARQQVELARMATQSHSIKLEAAENIGKTACDQDRMAQVLANLLSNAVKYSEGGEIKVQIWEQNGELHLGVSDQGPGIPADRLESVFEPHVRLGGDIKGTKPKGAGLGLFISKGIIEAHGGRIWVESKIGAGCTFVIVLPKRSSDHTRPAEEERVGR